MCPRLSSHSRLPPPTNASCCALGLCREAPSSSIMASAAVVPSNLGKPQSIVIDGALLSVAIEETVKEHVDQKEDGDYQKYDLPAVDEVKVLRLSFKNIYKISHLEACQQLVELRLDNNTISRIENLGHLVNLKWLDLSFNNIPRIEGLENLTKLTDLTLFNNSITHIENLDACKSLNVLSLGNNQISSTEDIQYLRQFPALEVVNLEGNPVCDEVDYKTVCLAYLPKLNYLDWALVNPAEVQHSMEAVQDDLMELKENEGINAANKEKEDARAEQLKQLADANLDVTETLFHDMFRDDVEIVKYKIMPGVQELIEDFEDKFKTSKAAFQQVGLEQHVKMAKEEADMRRSLLLVTTETNKHCITLVTDYRTQAKRTINALRMSEDPDPAPLEVLRKSNKALATELLTKEMACVEQVEELLDTFEISYGEMKAAMLDHQQTFFRAVEEQEEELNAAVTTIAENFLKKAADGAFAEASESIIMLGQDREALNTMITTSHDIHLGKLLTKEEETRDRENQKFKRLLSEAREAENNRNRDRVVEIRMLIEAHEATLNEATEELFGDDGY